MSGWTPRAHGLGRKAYQRGRGAAPSSGGVACGGAVFVP
uniref:Uncharacterized protein n=1 Tax=Siphoviridae sp. ctMOb8 TaxID=2825460 RepID=A0A8S5Q0T8_9CAUD|nr:MAG TPA: hypothetical protein [Siphoviridae sp. ctMOb8]